jgi:hypothetical protein
MVNNDTYSPESRLKWYNNNQDAFNMVEMILEMLHIWDDVVDKDNEVTEQDINKAFSTSLIFLPMNPFYRQIQPSVIPMWVNIISAYETANKFEREKDNKGLNLSYSLRSAIGQIIGYSISILNTQELSRQYIPLMWKWLHGEDLSEYRREHLSK